MSGRKLLGPPSYLEQNLSASMGKIWSVKHTAGSVDGCFSEPQWPLDLCNGHGQYSTCGRSCVLYTLCRKTNVTPDMLTDLDWHSTYMTTWNIPVTQRVGMGVEASDESAPGRHIQHNDKLGRSTNILNTKCLVWRQVLKLLSQIKGNWISNLNFLKFVIYSTRRQFLLIDPDAIKPSNATEGVFLLHWQTLYASPGRLHILFHKSGFHNYVQPLSLC